MKVRPKSSFGFRIMDMLKITKVLRTLRPCKGFEQLLKGFANPTQILASYFEVVVAGWCVSRAVSQSLEFFPEVLVKGRRKRPEFLWKTELGELYCECKRAETLENSFLDRLSRLRKLLEATYEEF